MKKKIFLAAICMVFISASLCQALPTYTVTDVGGGQQFSYNGGTGGVFLVNASFYTYCLETGEYLSTGYPYPGTIDSTIWYGTSATGAHDTTIEANTKKLYDYYLDNISNFTIMTAADRALIQEAIWYFQGQLNYTPSGNPYTSGTYSGTVRNIEALNLWYPDGSQYTTDGARQSLLIDAGTPVPEPSILILLGLGLVGLAGMRRKF